MLTIIAFILILGLLVLVHEFGHFIAAKKNGVYVEEFGFGYPPRLFGFKFRNTLYSINLIPLGGFVKLYGEEAGELGAEKTTKKIPSNQAFTNKKPWQKLIILCAGVLGNFLLGWILISILFTQGIPIPTKDVIIDRVAFNSPAQYAGLKPKDILLEITIDNKIEKLKSTNDLIDLSKKYAGQKLNIKIKRANIEKIISIVPRKNPPTGQGPLGIVVTSFIEKRYPWYQAPFFGLIEAFNITIKIVSELGKTLFQLLTFKKPQIDVAGPIGIAQFTGQAIKFGRNAVLEFIALLSLNLAVLNIFPFPALDGGRLVFVIYEWITKKRVNKNLEKYLNLTGFSLLILLALLVSISDVIKLIKK